MILFIYWQKYPILQSCLKSSLIYHKNLHYIINFSYTLCNFAHTVGTLYTDILCTIACIDKFSMSHYFTINEKTSGGSNDNTRITGQIFQFLGGTPATKPRPSINNVLGFRNHKDPINFYRILVNPRNFMDFQKIL